MKLDEKIKGQIDSYFESMSADELYDILISKYGFPVKQNRKRGEIGRRSLTILGRGLIQ